ncbi:MAG: hypothetical protein IKY86_01805 [Clostridia bacterium]|nr:hypothetical protein [Clostridia bacterium]
MGRIWVAVICVLVLVAVAAGTVFFATVGSSMVSNGLAALAARSGPGVALTLYRWSVSANPYDAAHRLALYELYLLQGEPSTAQILLEIGIDGGYATGPDLYLALAVHYVNDGRLSDACSLLDSAPSDYLARRLWVLRPKNAAAPPSGAYAEGLEFSLSLGEGTPWYRLDGGAWTLYGGPLTLKEGRHTLEVVTLDRDSIPSRVDAYQYTVEKLERAAATFHFVTCPYCGEMWMESD